MLRPYLPRDYDQVVRLFLLNTPRYFYEREQQDLEAFLNEEIENYFVIENKGEVLASGGSNIENGTGWLSWYIVHPAYQGKGYGTQLVRHNLDILKNTPGLNSIEVRTSQLVFPFYERAGFMLTGTKDNYWGPGFHLYRMTLRD